MKKTLLTIVITALVVAGGYYLYDNYSLTEKDTDTYVITDSEKPALPTAEENVGTDTEIPTDESNEVVNIPKNEGIFYGPGFTFKYPSGYVADNEGLWKEDLYESHINPPAQCSTCHIPAVAVQKRWGNDLVAYIAYDLTFPGKTLEEIASVTGVPYEELVIGDHDFIRMRADGLHTPVVFYTKNGNHVLSFRVEWDDRDTKELRDMIATLKFDEDCGDYAEPGDRGWGNFYSVCRNVNSGECFYEKHYLNDIKECEFFDPTDPEVPINEECDKMFDAIYDFEGSLIEKGLTERSTELMCQEVLPSYIQSRIHE